MSALIQLFARPRRKLLRPWARRSPEAKRRLQNNIVLGVAFLELANGLDFPANIWNDIPVPIYAFALMIVGGVVCLALMSFAVWDTWRAWGNLQLLRAERRWLFDPARKDSETVELTIYRRLNLRDLGNEVLDRIMPNVLLGSGGIVVGVGTLMATAGANPNIYEASNLLTGYIGNSPSCLVGVMCCIWAGFVFARATRHLAAATPMLPSGRERQAFARRIRALQLYCTVRGVTVCTAAAAGMITATQPWGYYILAPCVASAVFLNLFYRRVIGYERRMAYDEPTPVNDEKQLAHALTRTITASNALKAARHAHADPLPALFGTPAPDHAALLAFVHEHDLWDAFTTLLVDRPGWTANTAPAQDASAWQALDGPAKALVADAAAQAIREHGERRLRYNVRHLIELYGTLMSTVALQGGIDPEEVAQAAAAVPREKS